jgi:hypothetical protein
MTCSAALEKKGDICHPRFTALEKQATWSPPTFQKETHTQYPLGKRRGLGCIYSQDNATERKRTHKAKPILKKKPQLPGKKMFPVTKISTNVHIDSKSSRPPFEKKGHTKYNTQGTTAN